MCGVRTYASAKILTGCGIGCAVVIASVAALLAYFAIVTSSVETVPGDAVSERDRELLAELGVISKGETLTYFYSTGLWSIREGGILFTERRLVSYEQGAGAETIEAATCEEIADVTIEYSDSWLDDSVITVTRTDGSEFILVVSNSNRGDRKFVNRLRREHSEHRSSASVEQLPTRPLAREEVQ